MKKKPNYEILFFLWKRRKNLLTMKLLLCFILFSMLNVSGSIFSQSATFDLAVNGKTVKEVFKDIESQSQYRFLYNDDFAGLHRVVSFNTKDNNIDEVLSELLAGANLSYRELDNELIVITPKIIIEQERVITGTVTDVGGGPLPGATVMMEGTTIGTVTNINGEYSLSGVPADGILVFSYVGMRSERRIFDDQLLQIDVILREDLMGLDEVVVVGYGVQRRANITGSLTIIDSEELQDIAVPTLTQTLMGRAAGVFIKDQSGQPGESGAIFNIRGYGAPLIIVDGTPVSVDYMSNLEPSDIQSFNVLKDASAAAIYGARAGNGVILIETKRGQVSAPQFSYNGNFSQQFFTLIPERVNSFEYAAMQNVARVINEEAPEVWSMEDLQKFKDGSDPINYPDTDWWRETLKDRTPQHQHNFSIRGGTETVRYYTSLGYLNEKGMLISDDINHDRFSLRSNIDIKLTEKLDASIDLTLTNHDYIGPSRTMEGRTPWFLYDPIGSRIFRSRPFARRYDHPDPQYLTAMLGGLTVSPYHMTFIDRVGFNKWDRLHGFAKLGVGYELPFGFSAKAVFDMNRTTYRNRWRTLEGRMYDRNEETDEYIYRRSIASYNFLEEENSIDNNLNRQYFLNWNRQIDRHNFTGLFVHEILFNNYDYLYAFRRNFEIPIDYLFAGPDANKDNNGYAREEGRKAYITRMNYNYDNKYLFEFSARMDGSPKFPEETRWGFFPSASLGWIVSEEDFMRRLLPVVSNMKLRASYGKLGFDAAGAFQYLSTFRIASRYIYGNSLDPGIRADGLTNPNITWETMTTSNIGLEFSLGDTRWLDVTIDYFYRLRTDVLGTRATTVPAVVGATLPPENMNEFDNRGWEFTVYHRNRIGEFDYRVGGNISTNREKTVWRDQREFEDMERSRRGNQIGEWTDRFWTWPTDGLFKSQDEIDNWADIDGQGNRTIQIGDIKFIDYNEDGRITVEDQIVAGRGTFPRLMYGIDLSASWKGFDFMMLWQGAGMYNINLRHHNNYTTPFWASNSPMKFVYDNSYTPENPYMPSNTENALFPRYGTNTRNLGHTNFNRTSQFWLINGAYIRLKNVQLGYNIPRRFIDQLGVNNLKVYLSGYNLLTIWNEYFNMLDPEMDHTPDYEFGSYYPTMANIAFGVQMNF